ncbi:ABC transporter substrate-binding protein [Dermacoccus sp. Tok2021]|uniref:ABC transporter substrate-binding protein n=1 Tax=Dermacoccus sp. Tok2021 TaxID=2826873 RepID=UPI001CA75F9A|nr:ABC transporter substrate-binding protein [Dermacoccus sp. Tok2021]MBZ4498432.1 ABC transporter substrate-binding protein [Dermacoccus sp. Tok2021]
MRTTTSAVAAFGAAALLLSGCGSDSLDDSKDSGSGGSSSSSSAAPAVKKDDALAKLVPADIAKMGTLTVGTDASYAPNEFTAADGKTIQGMDIDLLKAVAAKLGLKLTFQNGGFDSLIGGVTSNKYPLAISSFTINEKRMQQVSMVQYFNAGTSWATAKGNPKKVDVDKACGLTIGVQKGTVQADDDLPARNKNCVAEGKKANKLVVEAEQSKVTADLIAGKVDAFAADSPITAWAVAKNEDKLEKVGSVYEAAPYGIVVAKDQTKFAEALSKALESLEKDGTYKKILEQWNNGDGAVNEFPVNPKA